METLEASPSGRLVPDLWAILPGFPRQHTRRTRVPEHAGGSSMQSRYEVSR